jgi:antitoxin component YwqK of YwqJK toxin-antitoxin module
MKYGLYLLIFIVLSACKTIDHRAFVRYAGTPASSNIIYYTNGDSLVTKMDRYSNGILRSKVPYNDSNQMHGEGNWYHENGALWITGSYKNGLKNGLFKFYYSDSTLNEISKYKNGKGHGSVKVYYQSGILARSLHYKNDLKTGTWFEYNDKGELSSIKKFKKDSLITEELIKN